MRRLIALAAALAAVAALAFGAGSATAADTPSLGDDVAARLGITADQLRAAFKAALNARIDAAVAAGRLTPEQGAKLKERVADAKGLGIGVRGRSPRGTRRSSRGSPRCTALGAAAKYLGMTPRSSGRRAERQVARPDRGVEGQERRRPRRRDRRPRQGTRRQGRREREADAAARGRAASPG